jgi:nitric oxide reductase large subunit
MFPGRARVDESVVLIIVGIAMLSWIISKAQDCMLDKVRLQFGELLTYC